MVARGKRRREDSTVSRGMRDMNKNGFGNGRQWSFNCVLWNAENV
jgi:hypothetical protein